MMCVDRLWKVFLKESKENLSPSCTFRRCVSLGGGTSAGYDRFGDIISSQFRCEVGRKTGCLGCSGKGKFLDYSDVCVLCLKLCTAFYLLLGEREKRGHTAGAGL